MIEAPSVDVHLSGTGRDVMWGTDIPLDDAELVRFLQRALPDANGPVRVLSDARDSTEAVQSPRVVVDARRLNDSRHLSRRMREANRSLPIGGHYVCRMQILPQRRRALRRKVWRPLLRLAYGLDFVLHRAIPKLPGIYRLYFWITGGRGRALSKTEAFGRLAYCGFEVVSSATGPELYHILARKVGDPRDDQTPTYGPVCRIPRIGFQGDRIYVYKLRTMHPFAEYIQDYVYRQNQLAEGGKFRRDFRITRWGRFLRRTWLDELPMLVNLLKGELKLVGVRPLTEHYFSLYREPFRSYRQQFKPGLIPPYYADLPKTFDEIVASEEAYLKAWERHPHWTDVRYLAKVLGNIFIRGVRSG